MSITIEDVYRSSNGDRWQVLYDPSNQQAVVRHLPNTSSGGAASQLPAEDFLRSVAQVRNSTQFEARSALSHPW